MAVTGPEPVGGHSIVGGTWRTFPEATRALRLLLATGLHQESRRT